MTNVEKIQKQKTIMPSLKENQRYLVYKISLPAELGTNEKKDVNVVSNAVEPFDFLLHKNIVTQCITLLGIFESAKAGVMPVKNLSNRGILRVNSRYVDKLKICLGLIQTLKSKGKDIAVNIECIHVSGMINKAEMFLDPKTSLKTGL